MTGAVLAHLRSAELVSATVQPGTAWVGLIGGWQDALNAPQVALIDQAGLEPFMAHNTKAPARPGLQVLVRGLPNTGGPTRAQARAVWEALHEQEGLDTVLLIKARHSPAFLGFDEANRPRYTLNFDTIQQRS